MVADPFWTLRGPARFAERAASRVLQSPKGFLGITVPSVRPPGFVDAVIEAARERDGGRVVRARASEPGFERSIPHGLARAGGVREGGIHSISALISAPELVATTFVIDDIDRESWNRWSSFLRSFSAEFHRAERSLTPRMIVCIPVDLPRGDVAFLFGREEMQWRAYISPLDTRRFVADLLLHDGFETLVERVAAETIVRLAGWDLEFARILARHSVEELADPLRILASLPPRQGVANWSAGSIDEWDGVPYLHSMACLGLGDSASLKRRVWQAQTQVISPFVADVIDHFVDLYGELLAPCLPFPVETRKGTKFIRITSDLEVSHLYSLLHERISRTEVTFLKSVAAVRNAVAHHNTVDPSHIVSLSEAWETLRSSRTNIRGWDWPRCGQKLVLMVGPSGAGKSTLAGRRHAHDSIVSSDAIRVERHGSLTASNDQGDIFAEVGRQVRKRLAGGETVVVDATNLRRRDRLALVDLAPGDIHVVYEVVDRPLAAKLASGGWRLEREGLIEGHDTLFNAELTNILEGDGRSNVEVVDLREAPKLIAPAA